MSSIVRRSPAVGAVVLAIAVSLTIAGASSAAQTRRADDSLSVAVSFAFSNYVAIYTADAAGLFKKYGVDVKLIDNTGANTLNMVASGQADIAMIATPQGLIVAKQGLPVTFFANWSKDPGSWLIGGKGIKTLADLKALGNSCHIGALPVGQQSYGYGQVYTHSSIVGIQNCTVDPITTSAQILAELASGQIQAVACPYTIAYPAITSLGATVLVNPELPSYRKTYNLPNFSSAAFFGTGSNLQSKRSAVVKFLKAMNDADKLVIPKNMTMLTNYMLQYDVFKPIGFAALRQQLQHTILSNGANMGLATPADRKAHPNSLTVDPQYISASEWKTGLRQYQGWGLANFDANDPTLGYLARVDMSYLSQALGKRR